MKLLIFLFLLLLLTPYGAQLRTRYTPLPLVRRPRGGMLFVGRRRVVFVGYMVLQ